MVRTSKTEKTSTAAPAVAAAPAAAPAVVAAPVKKERASKKEKAVAAPAPVEAAPVVAAPAVDAGADNKVAIAETSSAAKFNELNAKIQQLTSVLTTLKNDIKSLEKTVAREQKLAQKSAKSVRKSSGNKAPSGFVKPARISDELASFLGKAVGTEMARTEVSREITKYIKENNLQLATNRRIITPDNKLTALLKYKSGDEPLSYFNLQRYLSPHFIKNATA